MLAEPGQITRLGQHLICIANDLRAAGDVELVMLKTTGVSPQAITLADELWLIAIQLDDSLFGWRAAGPDAHNDGREVGS